MKLPPWEYLFISFNSAHFHDLFYPIVIASLVLMIVLLAVYNLRTRQLRHHPPYLELYEWLLWTGVITFSLLVIYAVFAGADFGGGVWDLAAGGQRASAQRRAVSRAMGPVWEANHVWLIFLLTGLFTAFPAAFARLAPVGTTIRFVLNEPARATVTFSQRETGRLAGGRCVSRTRATRLRPRCKITHVRGRLVLDAHGGQNQIRFQGRVSKARTLAPGRYTLTITARDSAGNGSQPTSTGVAIVR